MLKDIIILLPFLVSLFWTTHFLLNRKKNSRSQNVWTVAIGLICIIMGASAFYWYANENYSLFYQLDIIESVTTLSFVPVIFLYFKELTGDFKRWNYFQIALFFFPAFLFGSVAIFVYLYLGDDVMAAFSRDMIENLGNPTPGILPDSPLINGLHFIVNEYTYSAVLLIQTIAVIIYAFYRILLYRRRLNDFFSNVDDMNMKHYWAISGGILVFLIFTFAMTGLGFTLYVGFESSTLFIFSAYALILYFICHHVSCSYYTPGELVEEINLPDDIGLTEDVESKHNLHFRHLSKFDQIINDDKLFLQKNLRIDDIASLVGTNRTYISRILKDEYNCSFWEFINRKRIEYAKEQACRYPDYTVETLAELCGFSHGTAFSRTFRQYEGVTFREWQKGK